MLSFFKCTDFSMFGGGSLNRPQRKTVQPDLMRPDRLVLDGRRGGPLLSVDWGRGMGGEEGRRAGLRGDEGGFQLGYKVKL